MRQNILFFLAVVAMPIWAAAQPLSKVTYPTALDFTVKVILPTTATEPRSEWLVTLTLKGSSTGSTEFELPNKWAGRDDLFSGIKDLSVSGDGITVPGVSATQMTDEDEVKIFRASHTPNAVLTVKYRLTRIGDAYPKSQSDAYSPVLEKNYFHVIGHGAWVVPRVAREQKLKIAMRWQMPADWVIANSFETSKREQKFTATMSAIRNALYLGGDFRLAKFSVRGHPVTVALRDDWGFFDKNFANLAQRIFSMERAFWPDYKYAHALISAIQVGPVNAPGGANLGGTGLENAFALFLSPRTQIKDLRHLIAHELWHNWNPGKLGELKEPERLLYWWSEGFTDFYTYRLMLRNGLVSNQEYANAYNDVLRRYMQSGVRNAQNSRIGADFWNNEDVKKLAYQRGMLLAARLDREIGVASQGKYSLDDVMRDLYVSDKPGRIIDAAVLDLHISRRLGRSYIPEISRYIDQGETLEPDRDDLGRCFERRDIKVRAYEPGFDIGASVEAKKVIGVIDNGPAYRAGLRNNMLLRGWSIYNGDTSKEIELSGLADDKPLEIKFLPVGDMEFAVPQFALKSGLDKGMLARCGR